MVGIIFIRNDFNAPALEAITFAGRVGGHGDGVASEVEVVEVDRAVVIGVVDSGHILDVLSTGSERNGCEVQVAGELVAGFCRIAGRHVLFVYGLVQGRPGDLLGNLVRNADFEGDVGRQLLSNCAQFCIIVEVQILRQRKLIEAELADGDEVVGVVAAETETFQRRGVELDVLVKFNIGQRSEVAVQSCIRIDVVRGDLPVGDEVRPAVHGLTGHVAALTFAAPELEGVAVAGRGGSVCGGQSRTLAGRGLKQALVSNAVCVGHVVNNLLIVVDHALEVRPAVDGFLGKATGRICGVPLIGVPQAVVVPAVEVVLAGVVCGVVIGNVQLGQVNDRALGHLFECDSLVSLFGVAVAVDDNLDGLLLFALDNDGCPSVGDGRGVHTPSLVACVPRPSPAGDGVRLGVVMGLAAGSLVCVELLNDRASVQRHGDMIAAFAVLHNGAGRIAAVKLVEMVVLRMTVNGLALDLDLHARELLLAELRNAWLRVCLFRAAGGRMRAAGNGAVTVAVLRMHAGLIIITEAVAVVVLMLVLFPDRSQCLGIAVVLGHGNRVAGLDGVAAIFPALEVIASLGQGRAGNRKFVAVTLSIPRVVIDFRLAAVLVVDQREFI